MGRGDKWQEKTFSNAVSNGKISQEDWEIAMGQRCSKCNNIMKDCACSYQYGGDSVLWGV